MTTAGSALAQVLAGYTEADVVQAVELYYSLYPKVREPLLDILNVEPSPRYVGRVLTFDQGKKFGFIRSEQATTEFDKDVFCSSDEIGEFRIGQDVSFTVVLNRNNQPQARLLKPAPVISELNSAAPWRQPAEPATKRQRLMDLGQSFAEIAPPPPPVRPIPTPPPSPPQPPHSAGYIAPPPPPVKLPPRPPPEPPAPVHPVPPPRPFGGAGQPYGDSGTRSESQRFVGSILSFNAEKNFGFISSPAAFESFGKDVFLSSMEIRNFTVGDTVSFDVTLNKNGNPQARNLDVADGSDMGTMQAVDEPEQRFVGTISTYDQQKCFGFIRSPDTFHLYGKDVFVSSHEINDFRVGDEVSFRVALNHRGHPQARELAAHWP